MNSRELARYIRKMRPPYKMSVIDIDITNRCNLRCSNCTRLIPYQNKTWDMSIENFERAVDSLIEYKGVIGILGGNPCLHPQFDVICEIFKKKITDSKCRGLWTNHFHKHRQISEATFGTMNLNPHGNPDCIRSLEVVNDRFGYHRGFSRHAPILLRLKDFIKDEKKIWSLISKCDINQRWSATIIEYDGNIKAYFCEVAASLDLVLNLNKGIDVVPNWWKNEIEAFFDQITTFCPNCGIPLNIKGPYDYEEIDYYSEYYENLVKNCRFRNRKRIKIESLESLKRTSHVVDYSINAKVFRIANELGFIVRIFPEKFRKFIKRVVFKSE